MTESTPVFSVDDPFTDFKSRQKEAWSQFAPLEASTIPPAGRLVQFANVRSGQSVLDVACGTGVVAVTAARLGARVKGLDLTPALLERARWNAETAGVGVEFVEGDLENLPYPDSSFDCVLSQFGHIFGPRPEIAVREMLRVLKPGGTLAFTTWPPEMYTGRMFTLVDQYAPPPPGAAPPALWGEPTVIRERLGERVTDLRFERHTSVNPSLSPTHNRLNSEKTAGPIIRLIETLRHDPTRLAQFRRDLETLIEEFREGNTIRQGYLMARATKI